MSSQVRDQAIDPAHSFLVQAPAGSGKTELLTQRILALLAMVDEPEEILALTFTRKAASEMRNRVIESLNMSKPEDQSSHKFSTWKLAHAALCRSQEKQWHLTENPNRLRIMTLDSLTGSLARQLPLLSGLGDTLPPTEHTRFLCKNAAEKALNQALQHHKKSVETLLLHHDHNTVAVIDLITDMLENREQWLKYMVIDGRNHDQLRQLLESNMEAYMTHHLQRCDAHIPPQAKANIPALIRFAGSHLGNSTFEDFQTWPDSDLSGLEQWYTLANFLLTKDVQFRKKVTKANGFPTDAKDEKNAIQIILNALADTPDLANMLHMICLLPTNPQFTESQWQLMQSLFTLLPLAVAELQSSFTTQGKTDFTEIALRALHALSDNEHRPSDLLLKLDYRLHHILIDEFQDTSELQIQLLRCLTSGWEINDHRTLFMVGDPMQSIYRFRKAEVGLFLQAADNQANLPSVTPLKLMRNFRSSPVIVDWVNRAFQSIFPNIQDEVSGAIPHAKAEAALSDQGHVCIHLQESDNAQAEAEQVVQLIQDASSEKQRVGVLARTRKHLHVIIEQLEKADIAFRAIRILSLNTRPEVRLLRALTRALLHTSDRESWAALLRSPCCGLNTDEMFSQLAGDDRNIWEIINDDLTTPRISHLKHALTPAMSKSGKIAVRDLVETSWHRLGMPQALDQTSQINIETVLQLIDQLDGEHVKGRIDLKLFDERLGKLYAAPNACKDAEQVELMTMHGAKGLQWDVVILPGLGKAPKSSDSPLLAFTEASLARKPLLLMSPKAETLKKYSIFSCIQNIEKDKQAFEFSRLLYVACTRAEKKLHILGHTSKKGDA
ncbi:MAG: UvrD-helicase domain-containing protein, partial [Mariprofundaceae bacterium]